MFLYIYTNIYFYIYCGRPGGKAKQSRQGTGGGSQSSGWGKWSTGCTSQCRCCSQLAHGSGHTCSPSADERESISSLHWKASGESCLNRREEGTLELQTGGNWTLSPLSSALPTQEIETVSQQVWDQRPRPGRILCCRYMLIPPFFLYVLLKDTLFCSTSLNFLILFRISPPSPPGCHNIHTYIQICKYISIEHMY